MAFSISVHSTLSAQKHNVGFVQKVISYQKASMQINLWYPAQAPEKMFFLGPYSMRVAVGASPIMHGKNRLILLSHGSCGNPLAHRTLALALASAGYMVAAPLHPFDNYLDQSQSGKPVLWKNRPRHLKACLDFLSEDKSFSQAFDPNIIGGIGFSLGGYTLLALLGARPTLKALLAHREKYPEDTLPFDSQTKPVDLATLRDQLAKEEEFCDTYQEKRLKAAVLMAPMCALFDDETLQMISNPVSIYCAEHDRVLREPYHARRLAKQVKNLAQFSCISGAGHFSFLSPFPNILQQELPELSFDDPGFDRVAFHKRLYGEVEDFFDRFV